METEKPKKLGLDELLKMKKELIVNKQRLTDHEAQLRDETTDIEWENEYKNEIEAKRRKYAHQAIENNHLLNKSPKLKKTFNNTIHKENRSI